MVKEGALTRGSSGEDQPLWEWLAPEKRAQKEEEMSMEIFGRRAERRADSDSDGQPPGLMSQTDEKMPKTDGQVPRPLRPSAVAANVVDSVSGEVIDVTEALEASARPGEATEDSAAAGGGEDVAVRPGFFRGAHDSF